MWYREEDGQIVRNLLPLKPHSPSHTLTHDLIPLITMNRSCPSWFVMDECTALVTKDDIFELQIVDGQNHNEYIAQLVTTLDDSSQLLLCLYVSDTAREIILYIK
jgi:hypothetical protein